MRLLFLLCDFQISIRLVNLILLCIHIVFQKIHICEQCHELVIISVHLLLKITLCRLDLINLAVQVIQLLLRFIFLIFCIVNNGRMN